MPPRNSYTRELLADAVGNSDSFAGVLRHLGLRQAGGTQAHIAGRIRHFGIDTSHFTHGRKARAINGFGRRSPGQVLRLRPEGSFREKSIALRRALLELGRSYVCEHCHLDPSERGLTLHIDHINSEWLDNREENLRFLCPNCHSLTPSYCVPRGAVAQRQRQAI